MKTTVLNIIASKNDGKTLCLVLLYLHLTRLEEKGRATIRHVNPELLRQVEYFLANGKTTNTMPSAVDALDFVVGGQRLIVRAYPGERLRGGRGGAVRPQDLGVWLRREGGVNLFLVNGFMITRANARRGILGFLATLHEETSLPLHRTIQLAFRRILAYDVEVSAKRPLEPALAAEMKVVLSYTQARVRYIPGAAAGTNPFTVEDVVRPGYAEDDGTDLLAALSSMSAKVVRRNVDLRTLRQVIRAAGDDCVVVQTFADLLPLVKGMSEGDFRRNFDVLYGKSDRRRSQEVIAFQLALELDEVKPEVLEVLVDEPTPGPEETLGAMLKRIRAHQARLAPPRLRRAVSAAVRRLPVAMAAAVLAIYLLRSDLTEGWKAALLTVLTAVTLLLLTGVEYLPWMVRMLGRSWKRPIVDPTEGLPGANKTPSEEPAKLPAGQKFEATTVTLPATREQLPHVGNGMKK